MPYRKTSSYLYLTYLLFALCWAPNIFACERQKVILDPDYWKKPYHANGIEILGDSCSLAIHGINEMPHLLPNYEEAVLMGQILLANDPATRITLPALKGRYMIEIFMYLPIETQQYPAIDLILESLTFASRSPKSIQMQQIRFQQYRKWFAPEIAKIEALPNKRINIGLTLNSTPVWQRSFSLADFRTQVFEPYYIPEEKAREICYYGHLPSRASARDILIKETGAMVTLSMDHDFEKYYLCFPKKSMGCNMENSFIAVRLWYLDDVANPCAELGYARAAASELRTAQEIDRFIQKILQLLKKNRPAKYQECQNAIE